MSERTISRYEELYPKTVASQISDVYSKSETSNLFLPKSGGSMGGVLDMNGNKITNLAYPTDSLDSVNKKYVDESSPFKKVKIADNLNFSFTGPKTLTINYPNGFTMYDTLNSKFVLFEFLNLSVSGGTNLYLGTSSQFNMFYSHQAKKYDKMSYLLPARKSYDSGQITLTDINNEDKIIMIANSTEILVYFDFNAQTTGQVTGKVSIYFII